MTEIVISEEFTCGNEFVQEALSGRDITEFVDDEYLAYLDDDVTVERGEVVLKSEDGGNIEVDLYASGRLTVGLQRGKSDDIYLPDDKWVVFGLAE